MSKLSSKPPEKNVENIDDFLTGAEHKTKPIRSRKKTTAHSWEEAGVRDDVTKVYNLRLSEPYLMKLKYIAQHTPDSMQKFCLNVLQGEIDKKIRELTK